MSVDLDSNKIIVTAFIKKNTGLGFADLINKSRVDYLVELLRDGKHEEYTIEALAKMSGFGSRQTMYKAFAKFKKQLQSAQTNHWCSYPILTLECHKAFFLKHELDYFYECFQ